MGIHSISHAAPLFGTMMHCVVGMGGPDVDPQVDAHLLVVISHHFINETQVKD